LAKRPKAFGKITFKGYPEFRYQPWSTKHPEYAVYGGSHPRISFRDDSIDVILAEFPDLERDDILACIAYGTHCQA